MASLFESGRVGGLIVKHAAWFVRFGSASQGRVPETTEHSQANVAHRGHLGWGV